MRSTVEAVCETSVNLSEIRTDVGHISTHVVPANSSSKLSRGMCLSPRTDLNLSSNSTIPGRVRLLSVENRKARGKLVALSKRDHSCRDTTLPPPIFSNHPTAVQHHL
jgi:hypothetical protein